MKLNSSRYLTLLQ